MSQASATRLALLVQSEQRCQEFKTVPSGIKKRHGARNREAVLRYLDRIASDSRRSPAVVL